MLNNAANNFYLVFTGNEVSELRNAYHIWSSLIGTRTKTSDQSTSEPAIPLQLSKEEVCTLMEIYPHRIHLHESIEIENTIENVKQFISAFENYLNLFSKKQVADHKIKRIDQLTSMKDQILEGKRSKLNKRLQVIDRQVNKNGSENVQQQVSLNEQRVKVLNELNNLENEFNKQLENLNTQQPPMNNDDLTTHIFIKTPEFYKTLFKVRSIGLDEFLLTNTHVYNSCKYQVYKYFWSNGFYLTGGAKFGGDFLVYPDTPNDYHSQFIVVCIETISQFRKLTLKELITYARMATCVKKTFILAYLFDADQKDTQRNKSFTIKIGQDEKYELGFISINWSHI